MPFVGKYQFFKYVFPVKIALTKMFVNTQMLDKIVIFRTKEIKGKWEANFYKK